jgi:hypothetical protein
MRTYILSLTISFALSYLASAADEKKPDDPKPGDKKVEPNKADEKKPDDPKKPDVKKPDDKKDDAKKPDDPKKADDKKAADTKKVESKSDKKKKDDAGDGMVPAGQITAIVRNTGSSKKGITLGVETYELRLQGRRITPAKVTKNVDLQPADDMVVRMLNPPPKFVDGKAKPYTSKELKAMRGDSKLPGYSADLENLKADQIVQVQLIRKKDAPKPKAPPKNKDKSKDKDDEIDESLPQIKMIVIISEVKDS